MADPIIQNQNGQTTQAQPQTNDAELNFDLNLPNNEEATETPEISLNFDDTEKTEPEQIIKKEIPNPISTPEEIKQQEVIQEPTITTEPTIEIEKPEETIEEMSEPATISENTLELNAPENPEEISKETNIEETNINNEISNDLDEKKEQTTENQNILVENTINTAIQEIKKETPETDDNRIEKEDALVEEKPVESQKEEIQNIEKKDIPAVQEESLNILNEPTETPEIIDSIIEDNQTPSAEITETTKIEQNLPQKSNLEQDYKIIQQIQETSKTPQTTAPAIKTEAKGNEVNLDDILNDPTPQNPQKIPAVNLNTNNNPTIQKETPPENPEVMSVHGYSMPPIMDQISNQAQKPINKKILINFGLGFVFLIVGRFMFKTMYPLEYQNFIGNKQEKETIVSNEITENLNETIIESGAIENTDENSMFENPSLANYHEAPLEEETNNNEDFNAFEDFEQDNTKYDDETKEKIQNYVDIGKKYTVIGKKSKDEETTKQALFLYKKASALLLDIENETEISTDELNKQLNELETYLQKITGETPDEEIVLQQPNTPNPEDFFGGQNNPTETKDELSIPTKTTSSDQETQDETQDVSGDQDPIEQTNDTNR